jgi:hypothetical protein
MDLVVQRLRRHIAASAASRERPNRLSDPVQPTATFAEQQEIERLRREVEAERDKIRPNIAT